MSWTKRELITQAFEEVGLAAYVYDLSADQLQSCLRRLDSMMATWYAKGIKLGYPIPGGANGSDLDDDSYLPDYAVEAVYLNLGPRIAPAFGKMVSPDLKVSAKMAYDALLNKAAFPAQQKLTWLPSGAGQKTVDVPFLPAANTSPLQYGDNDELIFNGG